MSYIFKVCKKCLNTMEKPDICSFCGYDTKAHEINKSREKPMKDFYVNGFDALIGGSDCAFIFTLDSQPITKIRFSLNTAKSLQTTINDLIQQYEKCLGSDLVAGEVLFTKLKTNKT